jgi:2-polyprenyl-3-methyl-5-hydroxy-6-metoxy-1,4-benzoquinol methylase
MDQKTTEKLLALVKRNYQEIAADFDATRRKELWPEMSRLAEEVKDNDYVLDAGCGNGRLLEAWPDKKINYLGFDNSFELIELAQRNYPGREFMVTDILSLDPVAPGRKFDHIFCLAVLPHIPSRELRLETLEQLAQRLKPSGRLIISTWNLWGIKKYRGLIFKSYWHKIWRKRKLDFNDLIFPWKNVQGQEVSQRYYHVFTKRELRKLVLSTSLRILELKKDHYNYWLVLKNK